MGIGEIIALVVVIGVTLLLAYFFLPNGWAEVVTLFVVGLAIALLVALGLSFLAQWLWNMLMPSIFNLPMLSYWETFGLMVLGRLITGGGTSSGKRS